MIMIIAVTIIEEHPNHIPMLLLVTAVNVNMAETGCDGASHP
jgi:hypothetical protein